MLKRVMIVAVLLMLPLLGACAPQSERPTPTPAPTTAAPKPAPSPQPAATPPAVAKPQRGGTLVFAMTGEAAELDPNKTTVGVTRRYARFMYNTLVNTDENANIIPELAESWSNPDPKSYVFKLKKGVKFHDGTDFNAEAVKFNIDRIMDPATKGYGRGTLENVVSVEVIDDYAVKFNLKTPQPSLLGDLSLTYSSAMYSPAAVKKWGEETVNHAVGTGPFEQVEWIKGDHLTVKRFNGYWRKDEFGDPLPYLDQVIIKPIPDRSVMLTNLRTGNLDIMDEVEPTQVSIVENDKNLRLVYWGNYHYTLNLNNAMSPFDNKALRQAVAWAIDREGIHKGIFGGIGEPAQYILSAKSWAFDPTGKFYTRDPGKAKEKLAEGGKPGGFKFVVKSYAQPTELRIAQAIAAQLAEVGIDMEIVPIEERQLAVDRVAGKFEAIFSKIGGVPAPPDPDTYVYRYFHSGSSLNYTKYRNPEVDKLLGEARVIYDQAQRKALYGKAQALIVDDSPSIWLHHDVIPTAMNQKVMGFKPNIDLYHLLFDWTWLKR